MGWRGFFVKNSALNLNPNLSLILPLRLDSWAGLREAAFANQTPAWWVRTKKGGYYSLVPSHPCTYMCSSGSMALPGIPPRLAAPWEHPRT